MAISIPRLARARRTVLAVSLGSALGLVAGGSRDVGARAASASPAAAPTAVSSVTSCADDGTPGTLRAAVDAASDGDTIRLTVDDEGPGFDFEKARKRSSGLGLVVALAQQLGGTFSVECKRGARCRVTFQGEENEALRSEHARRADNEAGT